MAPAAGTSADRFDRVFERAATAVIEAQRVLDEQAVSPASKPEVPGQRLVHAIPEARFDVEFGLADSQRIRAVFRRSTTRREQRHRLRFGVLAVPELVEPPGTRLTTSLLEPSFFLSGAEQRSVIERIARALETGRFQPTLGLGPSEAAAEAARLRRGRDVVAFRLQGEPRRDLVVRVADRARRDGVFAVSPDGVRLVSAPSDGTRRVSYRPLLELALGIRRWLRAGRPRRRRDWDPAVDRGPRDLVAFIDQLRDDHGAAVTSLASSQGFDLAGVEARLSFSVLTVRGTLDFRDLADETAQLEEDERDDGASSGDDDASDVPPATSSVVIRSTASGAGVHADVELAEVEFLPTGRVREELVRQLVEDRRRIARALSAGERVPYFDYLSRSDLQEGVVAFRSPAARRQEAFLVVWPASDGRDFAFAVRRRLRARGGEVVVELDRIRKIMGVVDDAEGVTISLKQYRHFHRLFEAVRTWRQHGRSSGDA